MLEAVGEVDAATTFWEILGTGMLTAEDIAGKGRMGGGELEEGTCMTGAERPG